MEQTNLIDKLNELKTAAFISSTPKIFFLKKIKRELHNVPKNKRDELKPFVEDLKKELFKNTTSIQGLNLDEYFDDILIKEEKTNDVIPVVQIKKENIENVELTFDQLLSSLLECLGDTLFNLKGYAILKLFNNNNNKFKVKVLYDDDYYYEPIEHKITKTFNDCDSSSIKNYEEFLKKGNVPETNILVLLLLTSKVNNQESLKETENSLISIFESFDEFEYCSLKNLVDFKGKFYKRGVEKEDFLKEIEYTTSKFLSNAKISFEEEKIIKKVFSNSSTPVLSYKLLVAGNSGAKVIEIKQIQPFTSGQYEQRFIVKFARKSDKRKLEMESKNFTNFIESYEGFNDYKCSFVETGTHDALRYVFAKSKEANNSYSYADIIDDSKNIFYNSMVSQIDKLFNLSIFEHWSSSLKKCHITLEKLYSNYVKYDKIKEQVLIIKNISSNEFEGDDFNLKLNKLLNYRLETNTKVCHGDLHSENFFIDDEQQLFLIDFGFTGISHSLVDHTSLECSIKFRHIPNYIELKTLLKVEMELLLDTTFDSSYKFKEISTRQDLHKYYDSIKELRANSSNLYYNSASKLEYYISLFFMTYRQVRYKEMNQLYALKSSEILLNKIIIDLGL